MPLLIDIARMEVLASCQRFDYELKEKELQSAIKGLDFLSNFS